MDIRVQMTSGESSGLKIKYIHFSKYLYLTLRVRLNEIILKKISISEKKMYQHQDLNPGNIQIRSIRQVVINKNSPLQTELRRKLLKQHISEGTHRVGFRVCGFSIAMMLTVLKGSCYGLPILQMTQLIIIKRKTTCSRLKNL